MGREEALDWGWVGPCLRGSGVAYDVRKDHPYSGYEQYDFDVPVGTVGDCYDRYLVRMEEMRQSLRIIEQALAKLPGGPVITDDKRVALPPKSEVYSNIEALMNHFKLIYEGILPPPGEVYGYTEAANGELGFYVVSDGTKCPWRVKVRPPCFNIYQAFPRMIKRGDARRRRRHHRRAERDRGRAGPVAHAQVHDRRQGDRGPGGDHGHPGRGRRGDRDPPLLLAPRPAGGRQLPHVPGRDREDAQAPDRLQHAGDGGHGGALHEPQGGGGAPHHAGVPAHQPPHRLPGLRPGRRVLPPGQLHGARALRREGGARGEGPQAQGRGPRPHHARRGALRALHALHPLRARGDGHQQLRAREPRRPHLRSPPSRTGPSPTATRATWPTSARWGRCSATTSASRCGSGS